MVDGTVLHDKIGAKRLTSGMRAVHNDESPVAPAGILSSFIASSLAASRDRTVRFMHRISTASISCAFYTSLILLAVCASAPAATKHSKKKRAIKPAIRHAAVVHKTAVAASVTMHKSTLLPSPVVRGGPWTEPTYADSTLGDFIDGEDLTIRKAAVDALGPYNGSVVVVDPETGRVLTMVNQRVALGSGFQPCSTIKVSVALAGLREGVIDLESKMRLAGTRMDLTYALAHSNNYYFATLGTRLGYEKVSYYAHLFGYGEKAGLNIPGEQPGHYPPGPPKNGGVGMLTSFGEEIQQTPLQLAALMSAVANGGTLYYLQYPRSQAEVKDFTPKIKRKLEIGDLIPLVKPGMRGAVEFGTAHRAREDGPIAGKTGTCSDNHTHLGWFGSFNDVGNRKLVVVVLLTGGRPVSGPAAAGIAGDVYRRLTEQNYFAGAAPVTPATLISSQVCCR